jgi:glycerol uptake facilitator-like aquaporin
MYHDLINANEPYWARIIMHEVFLSMLLAMVFLVIKYEKGMRKIDRTIKGFALALTIQVCLQMAAGSGAQMNPAVGLAHACYMIGYENSISPGLGD